MGRAEDNEWFLYLALLALFAGSLYLFLSTRGELRSYALPWLRLVLVAIAGVAGLSRRRKAQRLGVWNRRLSWRAGPGKAVACPAEAVLYSRNLSFLGRQPVPLVVGDAPRFDREDLINHVHPLLQRAARISESDAQSRQFAAMVKQYGAGLLLGTLALLALNDLFFERFFL